MIVSDFVRADSVERSPQRLPGSGEIRTRQSLDSPIVGLCVGLEPGAGDIQNRRLRRVWNRSGAGLDAQILPPSTRLSAPRVEQNEFSRTHMGWRHEHEIGVETGSFSQNRPRCREYFVASRVQPLWWRRADAVSSISRSARALQHSPRKNEAIGLTGSYTPPRPTK